MKITHKKISYTFARPEKSRAFWSLAWIVDNGGEKHHGSGMFPDPIAINKGFDHIKEFALDLRAFFGFTYPQSLKLAKWIISEK